MLLLRLLNSHISLPFLNLSTGLRSTNKLNINFFLVSDLCLTPSQYPLLICCHLFSPTNHILIENHRSLIQICITPSLESNKLTDSFRQPRQSCLDSPHHLSADLCHHHHYHQPSLLHSGLKTYLFNKSSHLNTSSTLDCLHDHGPDRTYHASRFIVSSFFKFFCLSRVVATRQLFTTR